LTYQDDLPAGFVPFGRVAGGAHSEFASLVQGTVHWRHARLHLKHLYPHLSEKILYRAYSCALRSAHGTDDPRIPMVFSRDLRFILGPGIWLDENTFEPVQLTDDSFNALPGIHDKTDGDGGPKLDRRYPRRDRARNALPLEGYKPIRVVHGISFTDDDDAIVIESQPNKGDPIRLLTGKDLLPGDTAFKRLELAFPDIGRSYLEAVIAARICADRGGRPPIVLATGPTGSGKGQTIAIGASFCGQRPRKVELDAESDEKFWRSLGANSLAGHQFLYIDESGRLRRPATLMRRLLEVSNQVSFRPLYQNHDRTVPMRGAIFLPTAAIPEAFAKSPELCRRCRLVRLYRTTPEWREACGGEAAEWRAGSKENARAANSVLTHVYELCARHDFSFDAVADELGLTRPDDGGAYLDMEAARDLYRHCRAEDGHRKMHTSKRFKDGRWVDGNATRCRELLMMFYTDDSEPGDVFWQLRPNVESLPWNQLLGIDDPNIVCELRKRGTHVAIRFRESGAMKGNERINEDLPPIPEDGPEPGPDGSGPQNPPNPDMAPLWQGQTPLWQKGCHNGAGRNVQDSKDLGHADLRSGSYGNVFPYNYSRQEKEKRKEESYTPKGSHICQNGNAENGNSPETPHRDRLPASTLWQPNLPDRCQNALRSGRFPTDLLVLDFETYFSADYSLAKMSIPEYVADARFHVHGLAVRYPDGMLAFREDVKECIEDLKDRYGNDLAPVTVAGHNLPFDAYILSVCYGIQPKFLVDSLGLARYCFPDMPNGLGDLADRFGLTAKGDALEEINGHRNLTPQQRISLAAYAKHDAELTYDIATRLLPQITNAPVELPAMAHTIKLFTERLLHFDVAGGEALLEEMEQHVQDRLAAAGIDATTARSVNDFTARLAEALRASGRSVPTKAGKNGAIPALAKSDEAMQALANDEDDKVKALAQARLAAKSAPQWRNRLAALVQVARARGGVPVALNYHGGHTGRFSGAQGSLQNLPGPDKLDVLGPAAKIGTLIVPRPGYKFIDVDLAQIECRVLAWLAGEAQILAAFEEGKDIYSAFASTIFGEAVRKPTADDPPDRAKRLKALRAVGKRAILGLGFGMGAVRFEDTLRSDRDAGGLFGAGVMTATQCVAAVDEYRRTYAEIPALWRELERAFRQAMDVGEAEASRLRYRQTDSGRIACELPSGRTMFYPNVEVGMNREITFGRGRKLYGGALAENASQAVARDVFVEHMLHLEQIGLRVMWHCHDGLLVEVKEEDAERALQAALGVFRTQPAWAEGLPLEAEAVVVDSFGG